MTERAESPTALPGDSLVPLEAVLCTEELYRRPPRPPDHETENRALVALAQALADAPGAILQTLAEKILEVFNAGSAGISLLTKDEQRFYWPAIAGIWKPHLGGSTPRDFGPCGDVLDRNASLLFRHFERRYAYLLPVTPPVEECLLVPFHLAGKAVGTIWAIAHDERRQFDAEDLRQLESLGRFASAAYQTVEVRHQGEDARRAALNLLEDAVQSRQAMETLNVALRDSERRFREMVDALPAALYTTDAEGRLTHFNPAAVEFSGRTPELGTDQWCVSWKLYRPDGTLLPHDECPMAVALKEGRVVRDAEIIAERPDGKRIWFTSYPTPLRDAEGRVIGGINMLVDITERRDAQEALQEADRRKDEFMSMLAHELRNPLAPIRNAVFLLQRAAGSESRVVRAVEAIDRQVGHQARLLDDLLDVSRIRQGKIVLRTERLDLTQLVRDAAEDRRSVLDEASLTLTLELPDAPVWVDGDPTRLYQVVGNLLHNAAKFTDRGGRVTVQLTVGEGDRLTTDQRPTMNDEADAVVGGRSSLVGPKAALTVRDTGIGIDPEMLPHVFETFAQADRSLDRAQGGLGLGLALVKGLVEAHGGEVRAASAGQGHGAEFTLLLPVASAPAVLKTIAPAAAASIGASRILIVEDNRDAAETLRDLLEVSGHAVAVAYSGSDAVVLARQFQPEVVLCDLGLPGMSGFEVAAALRQDAATATARLIAVSGYGQAEDRQHSQEVGFDLHLTKPIDPAELQRLLGA